VHVFHTKHDFTPELAWAAFQLLAQFPSEGVSPADLKQIARTTGSPLVRRQDLTKLLAAMQELGLVKQSAGGYTLSAGGQSLEKNGGRNVSCFRAAIHCLYCWTWLWNTERRLATPSWSYRAVCRAIVDAGINGVDQDDLVLRVVDAASRFGAEKISFSRSSVYGVAIWLEAQVPPLLWRKRSRLFASMTGWVSPTTAQFHLAALCELDGDRVILDASNMELLGEAWLTSDGNVTNTVRAACESPEFTFVPSSPPQLIAHRSEATHWIHLVREELPRAPSA
jgi:hypothetical protein